MGITRVGSACTRLSLGLCFADRKLPGDGGLTRPARAAVNVVGNVSTGPDSRVIISGVVSGHFDPRDPESYLSDPRTRKWVVRCVGCQRFGFRADAPAQFFGRACSRSTSNLYPLKRGDAGLMAPTLETRDRRMARPDPPGGSF